MLKDRILPILFIISFIIGFFVGEDTLGGGKHDYLYHEKYFFKFFENFNETYRNFGVDLSNENVRNSPIFYIIFSFLLKFGFTIELLKYFNLIIIIPITIFFYKCIDIKYPKSTNQIKLLLVSILFLSPTIRTLLIWPYPFIWGFAFFIISIYFYLKFNEVTNNSEKFKLSIFNVFFLAISSYFTPNFAIFSMFYIYKFYLSFGFSKKIVNLIILNIVLALPAIFFLISKDFYLFKSDGVAVNTFTKFNIANKIVIITSFIFLFFLPLFPKISEYKYYIRNFFNSFRDLSFIVIFIFLNIYFYDFIDNAGGGIFYHLSKLLLDNSLILYLIFSISIFLFYILKIYNPNNIIIFIVLLMYNMQFSIYYKYFDPLLIFIFLFFLEFRQKNFVNLEIISIKYAIFYAIFLGLNIYKLYISY